MGTVPFYDFVRKGDGPLRIWDSPFEERNPADPHAAAESSRRKPGRSRSFSLSVSGVYLHYSVLHMELPITVIIKK